jgi:hypothetical protein
VNDAGCAGVLRAASVVTAAAALFLGAAPVGAADDASARVQVEQKIRLVARLISDSPAAQRIIASGNAEAVGHLDEGRVHQALAEELLARGDLAGARRNADDALRHVALARRLAPDAPARQDAGTFSGPDSEDLTAAMGLLGTSRQQAQEGRFDAANQTLVQAEGHVLAGMNRSLHATTIDYTVRASNPAEEFAQELARHRGFAELLPLAIRDLKPRPEALAQIERFGEASGALHQQALLQLQTGDTAQALIHIRNATLFLQRALSVAGVTAPQPTGKPP